MKPSCWVLVFAAALLFTGCPEKRRPAGGAITPKPAAPKPLPDSEAEKKSAATGPLAEYGSNLVNAEKKAAQVSSLTTLEKAVRQFEAIEGRVPRSLDELITARHLLKLPVPPRGTRFTYDARTGAVNVEPLPAAAPEPAAPETAAPEAAAAPAS